MDYNLYITNALQLMIGDILAEISENGLEGDQHFYISFRTHDAGVMIPSHLKLQYPNEMTIVMQEWFDNLGVMDDRFAITLSFGGRAENLVIPFSAITAFSDPSVNFNLKFGEMEGSLTLEISEEEENALHEELSAPPAKPAPTGDAEVIQLDAFRKHDD